MSVSKALTSSRNSSAASGAELTSGCRSLARLRKLLRIASRSAEPGDTPRVAYTAASGRVLAYTARDLQAAVLPPMSGTLAILGALSQP